MTEEIELKLLLADTFNPDKHDIKGYWISEKLDGVRAYWIPEDGKIYSRNGKPYNIPEWFLEELPDEVLDGELWIGRGMFNKTSGIVRKKIPKDEEWKNIKFKAFDVPDYKGPYEKRVKHLIKITKDSKVVEPVETILCKGLEHAMEELEKVESLGGEGIMLRKPDSLYERKRSKTLLKVKSWFDEEAEVIGYEKGTGKYSDMTAGSLLLKDKKGVQFSCGSGMNDKQRENPPKIGSKVTYKYTEKSKDGIPRFPIFIGVRDYE